MHFLSYITTLILATLFITGVLAAPAPAEPAAPVRACDSTDTSCIWSFGIKSDGANGPTIACSFFTYSSMAASGPQKCGTFLVSSVWSSQFGPNFAYTLITLVGTQTKRVAWAGVPNQWLKGGRLLVRI
ncbi:hypothetical protein BDW74DRAFT_176017 [Aspergillus multicolor]|uniref:uncharacterized protein n=1 Tax=Aspergillus multicolor TaxID=41759 RepID=UPI003CCDC2C0